MGKIVTKKMLNPDHHNRTCPICNKTFYTYPSNIKLGRGIYCSVTCKSIAVGKKFAGKLNAICVHCGKPFHARQSLIKNGKGLYCSATCRTTSSIKLTNVVCGTCGKKFTRTGAQMKGRNETAAVFCSSACLTMSRTGENNPCWNGGISFEPYCPKWNDDIRNRIRNFFDNRCTICGKSQEDNLTSTGRVYKLHCHHVEYNKQACCDGEPVHFAALCNNHHGESNFDRARWEAMLHRIIDEIYGGRSYYTKEEWEALRRKAV